MNFAHDGAGITQKTLTYGYLKIFIFHLDLNCMLSCHSHEIFFILYHALKLHFCNFSHDMSLVPYGSFSCQSLLASFYNIMAGDDINQFPLKLSLSCLTADQPCHYMVAVGGDVGELFN